MSVKRCSVCNHNYPLDSEHFASLGKDADGNTKFRNQCKSCRNYRVRHGRYPPKYSVDKDGLLTPNSIVPPKQSRPKNYFETQHAKDRALAAGKSRKARNARYYQKLKARRALENSEPDF